MNVSSHRAYLGTGEPPQGASAGYTDFQTLYDQALALAVSEPDQLKKELLAKGAAIAAAAIPIPVAGWVIAGVVGILTILGITIRGRTQHPGVVESGAAANQYADSLMAIFDGLPADAQAKMLALAGSFDSQMLASIGDWWGGIIRQGHGPANTNPTRAGLRSMLVFFFYHVMHESDVATVEDSVKTIFLDRVGSIILQPLDAYMVQKYNATVEQYLAAGGTGLSTISTAGIGPVIGLGILGALLFAMTKKKRRGA